MGKCHQLDEGKKVHSMTGRGGYSPHSKQVRVGKVVGMDGGRGWLLEACWVLARVPLPRPNTD